MKKTLKYIGLAVLITIKANKYKTILWILFIMISSIITISTSVIQKNLIDNILKSLNKEVSYVYFWLVISIVLPIILKISDNVKYLIHWEMAVEADEEVIKRSMDKISKMKLITFDSSKEYNKIKNIIGYDFSLFSVNSSLFEILGSFINTIGCFIILYTYNIYLIPLTLVLFFLIAVINNLIATIDNTKEIEYRKIDKYKEYYKSILISKNTAKEVRMFNSHNYFLKLWKYKFDELKNLVVRTNWKSFKFSTFANLISIISFSFFIFICARDAWNNTISIGSFILFTATYGILQNSIDNIVYQLKSISKTTHNYDNYNYFISNIPNQRLENKIFLNNSNGINIRFENVSFKYNESDKKILSDISFEIKSGEKIALVGLNGAGKSTLIRLITGLYECSSGNIYINDENIQNFSQDSLYKLYNVVFQDYSHFYLTLRDNISLSNLSDRQNEEKLDRAISIGGVEDFFYKFKHGFDTQIGRIYEDDGVDLSGGEWQKVAISRSFFEERNIFIFDEPVASLDPYSEYMLMDNIIKHTSNNTVIIISHRLSCAPLVDKVLYLDEGKIIEQGNHNELINIDGKYAELFKLQSKMYKKE